MAADDIVSLDARAVQASVTVASTAGPADGCSPGRRAARDRPRARFPGALAIGGHFIDYVVHGWDVARTLGLDYELEPDLLGVALPVAEAVPDDQARLRPGAAFAPRVSGPEGATPLDQIVALRAPAGLAAALRRRSGC